MLADGARRWCVCVCVCVCVKGREERRIDGNACEACVGTMDGWYSLPCEALKGRTERAGRWVGE